jgi:hypothetical protein
VVSNLAETLHQRFGRTRRAADITRAIGHAERAMALCGPDDPHWAAFVINLGVAWRL